MPQRPSAGINDKVWLFLQKCWSMNPSERPSTTQLCDALPRFRSLPQTPNTPVGRLGIEDLPYKLNLRVESLRISPSKPDQRRFYVNLRYMAWEHTTSLSTGAVDGRYTWHCTYF